MDTKVFVFTRHKLTPEQAAGMTGIILSDTLFGSEETQTISQTEEASRTLVTARDAREIISSWIHDETETVVFGVFPPIIRAELKHLELVGVNTVGWTPDGFTAGTVRLFEAHSVNRAPEGGKPQFEFVEWLETAEYEF